MPEVVTRGTGEHEVVADRAEIQVTFSAEAADRSTAVSRLAQRMAAVEPALAPDIVEERRRSVSVQTQWNDNRRAGCTAQELLVLRVSDLAALDDLLVALFSAEPDWLNGPQWWLADDGVERPYPMAMPMAMAMPAEGSRMGHDSVRQLGLTPGLVTVRAACTAVWSLDR